MLHALLCSALQGDYHCIYPPPDLVKAEHFSHLLREAARVSLAGTQGLRRKNGSQALLGMKVGGGGAGGEERSWLLSIHDLVLSLPWKESQLQKLLLQLETTKSLMTQDRLSPEVAAQLGTSNDVDVSTAQLSSMQS